MKKISFALILCLCAGLSACASSQPAQGRRNHIPDDTAYRHGQRPEYSFQRRRCILLPVRYSAGYGKHSGVLRGTGGYPKAIL